MNIGDIVKGLSDDYGVTNTKMTKAVVLTATDNQIRIRVIEHTRNENGIFTVNAEDFEVIGHIKEFDRDKALKEFKANKRALLEYDLSDADLSGANLSDTDLSDANLNGADLSDANLGRADLNGADLSDANLGRADLRRADLRCADLNGADLNGADLSDTDLNGANLSGANLSDADLSGANLRRADLRRADLRCADLSGANLRGADLNGADLNGADLDFSAFPLWCGGLDVNIDDRQAEQLLYHLIRNVKNSKNTSDTVKQTICADTLIELANKFHRADECGYISGLETKEND